MVLYYAEARSHKDGDGTPITTNHGERVNLVDALYIAVTAGTGRRAV